MAVLLDGVLSSLGLLPEDLAEGEPRLPGPLVEPTDLALPPKAAPLPALVARWRERGEVGQVLGAMGLILGAVLAWRGELGIGWLVPWTAFHLGVSIAGYLQRAANASLLAAEARVPPEPVGPGERVPVEIRLVAGRRLRVETARLGLAESVRGPDPDGPDEAPLTEWSDHPQEAVPVGSALERGQELRILAQVVVPAGARRAEPGPPARRRWSLTLAVGLVGLPDAFLSWRFRPLDDLPEIAPRPAGTGDREPLQVTVEVLARRAACPFCGDPLATGAVVACATCDTLHHPDCWNEAGACTVYACGGTVTRSVVLGVGPDPGPSA